MVALNRYKGLEEVPTSPVSPPTVPMDLAAQGAVEEAIEAALPEAEGGIAVLDPDETQSSVKFTAEDDEDENQRQEYIKSIRLTPEQLVGALVLIFVSFPDHISATSSCFLSNDIKSCRESFLTRRAFSVTI